MSFRVTGIITGDGSQWTRTLNQARQQTERFGASISTGIGARLAGAFSIGAISIFAKRTLEAADNFDEMASRIGVSVEKLQEWTFAAKQAGADMESLGKFIEKLNLAASEPKNLKAFQAMGINPQGMSPGALFESVSAFGRGHSATEFARALSDAGLDLKKFGPLINTLQSDLDALGKSARDVGAVMDEATTKQLAHLNDQLSIVSQILMAQFAPAILAVSETILRVVGAIKGTAGELGARTANIHFSDLFKLIGGNPEGWQNLIGKLKEGERLGLDKLGQDEFAKSVGGMEELIARLKAFTPFVAPTIAFGAGPNAAAKGSIASDALTAVGNFLGAGGPKLQSVADRELPKQTSLQTQMLENLRTINVEISKLGLGGINVPAGT